MQLININDLYVGQLYLPNDIEDKFKKASRYFVGYDECKKNTYIDGENKYHSYFLLFEKVSDNLYCCIQNGKLYSDNSLYGYYTNLEPLNKYVKSNNIKRVPLLVGLMIFKKIFDKKGISTRIKAEKLYTGELKLCVGKDNMGSNYEYISLPSKLILDRKAILIDDVKQGINPVYDYSIYRCIFKKTEEGYLNIFDNVIYKDSGDVSYVSELKPISKNNKKISYKKILKN